MNHSDNSRTISLVCELRMFRVFVCAFFSAPMGLSGISKWAYLDSSFSFLIHAATNFVAVTNFFNSCVTVSDVTLAIDMQMTWRMKSTWMLQWNRSSSKWILLVAGPLKVIRMFLLVQVDVKMAICLIVKWCRWNKSELRLLNDNKIQFLFTVLYVEISIAKF